MGLIWAHARDRYPKLPVLSNIKVKSFEAVVTSVAIHACKTFDMLWLHGSKDSGPWSSHCPYHAEGARNHIVHTERIKTTLFYSTATRSSTFIPWILHQASAVRRWIIPTELCSLERSSVLCLLPSIVRSYQPY